MSEPNPQSQFSSSKDQLLTATDSKYKEWRNYQKISNEKKAQLVQNVFKDGKRIKEAALTLGIKYGSAKTIIFLHRQQKKKLAIEASQLQQGNLELKEAITKSLKNAANPKMQIQTIYAGEIISNYEYFKKMKDLSMQKEKQ